MLEKVIHYWWQHRMAGRRKLMLDDGRCVRILDPGIPNNDAGPDFSNAKIEIDGIVWAGNIEIHIKASDWFRHGHDTDPAYSKVLLHVVTVSDRHIPLPDGNTIPQLTVSLPQSFINQYSNLTEGLTTIRCLNHIPSLPSITVTDCLESLATERLQKKSQHILDIHRETGMDWTQTCFIIFARSLGFSLNSDPLELLAKSIPLAAARKHSDNPEQLEAMLFGQAGMLDPTVYPQDSYYQLLCREYAFLRHKHSLQPLDPSVWKYARTRPQNFPHRRIALLATTLVGGFTLTDLLLSNGSDIEAHRRTLNIEVPQYWRKRTGFGQEESASIPAALGQGSIDLLLINLVAPMLYTYGSMHADARMTQAAYDILEQLRPENNMIVRSWAAAGIKADNALRSQALIELRKSYCDTRRCLSCRIGHKLLRDTSLAPSSPLH